MSNTRRYMDFAPRRNGTNRQMTSTVSSAGASARPVGLRPSASQGAVVTGERRLGSVVTSAHPQKIGASSSDITPTAQCDKNVLATVAPEPYYAMPQKETPSSSTPAVAPAAQSATNSISIKRRSRVRRSVTQAKPVATEVPMGGAMRMPSLAEMPLVADEEDYWDSELGVIEDLDPETASQEETPEEPIPEKPKDTRVGFVGGKSPFINTEKLEKRPLSAFRRADKKNAPMPAKNNYADQVKTAVEKNDVPTMVVTGASKRSTFSLLFVILLVTVLGAAVGFVVYLAFFQ